MPLNCPSTFRALQVGPNSILEGACRVTFSSLLKAPSEIAVTSAPVSSLNGISWFSSVGEMNHVEFPSVLITPRNVSVVSSLVAAVFEKHCELKWPL